MYAGNELVLEIIIIEINGEMTAYCSLKDTMPF